MRPITLSPITELDMSDCEFGTMAIQEFNSELPVLQCLVNTVESGGGNTTDLALRFQEDSSVPKSYIWSYAMQLMQFCGLTSLDVSSNGMQDLALRELCITLENDNCGLERLVAYDNDFSMQAVEDYIFPMLRHRNCKLVGLNMVGAFGEDDDRLDGRRIDFEFSRLIFSRQLVVLSSARRIARVGQMSALRRLPNDLFRMMGTLLLPPVAPPFVSALTTMIPIVEEEEEEAAIDFHQINGEILKCTSGVEIEQLIFRSLQFNNVNVATAFRSLCKLKSTNSLAVEVLLEFAKRQQFEPRNLSSICHSFAKGQLSKQIPQQFVKALEHANVKDFRPQAFSNTLWAFGTLEHRSPAISEVWSGGHELVRRDLSKLSSHSLSNIAWACAVVNYRQEDLLELVSRQVTERMDFDAQAVSNLIWAFESLEFDHRLLSL
ncbi:hypothetical protein BASA81_012645 [Batrachochytrium salamandrivorans]|nr:hypothetical protein BASA81_012645 [Batrachochytrium salamandrivorans]